MTKNIFVFGLLLISSLIFSQENINYTKLQLDSIFGENEGAFVLFNLENESYQLYNPDRAKQKYAVHSTSKILWSIIGLEEGLIANETDLVKWDSVKYPPRPIWPEGSKQDQTIVSALNKSVNWYYYELLKLMTPDMIEKYLNELDYQKGYEVEKVQYYRLASTINKSALEQIDFLKSIYLNSFDLSDKTLHIVKKGILYKSKPGCTVYTRTGTGPLENDNAIGWLIGWVEKDTNTCFFAFNVEHEDELEAGRLRYEYGFRVLMAMKLME